MEKTNGGLTDENGLGVSVGKIEKMSKSKKNVVDPEDIIGNYGADTARWFMLSDSPQTEIYSGLTQELRHLLSL